MLTFQSISWLPVLMFAISMTGSPGPNNVMVTASGANYGYLRTIPHVVGIAVGCVLLYTLMGLGVGALLKTYPALDWVLKAVGSAYLLYLAWRIATAPPPALVQIHEDADSGTSADDVQKSKPLTLWQAALFQVSNPKAWVIGMTLMASFLPADQAVGQG